MPLHYVLLFPRGDLGFHWDLKLNAVSRERERLRMSQRAFYRRRLHVRPNRFSVLHSGGRLLQQYCVDAWASCGLKKLDWLERNQSKIRADVYNGLANAMLRDSVNAADFGKRFILPSSYSGGARNMQRLFQDSMTIVRFFCKSTLFMTFTASFFYHVDQRLWKNPCRHDPNKLKASWQRKLMRSIDMFWNWKIKFSIIMFQNQEKSKEPSTWKMPHD